MRLMFLKGETDMKDQPSNILSIFSQQLEMIEQTEEALLHEHPHIMKKTHKGEEEVEAEGEEDLSSLAATEVMMCVGVSLRQL